MSRKWGIVKWFNRLKGYGFVTNDDEEDAFVHYTEIPVRGYRYLEEGDKIDYDEITGDKGRKRVNRIFEVRRRS